MNATIVKNLFGKNAFAQISVLRFALAIFAFLLLASVASAQTNGKRPIIVIPGVTGSQLVNIETNKIAWFKFAQVEDDDLRLPMSTNLRQNRDKLVPGDILREVKLPSVLPDVSVYQDVLTTLEQRGYTEAKWDNPQAADAFYVFAYDWRRDNVESAQELIRKIEAVKAKLKNSDLKFDVVAHSMGGLIARYAAMYGAADLPAAGKTPVVTWAGAKHFGKILLFGTPNEGSVASFDALVSGYNIGSRNLPFVNDLSNADSFALPALYQLLPHRRTARVLDENLKPIKVDLYLADNWIKYGWGAIGDKKFLARLKDANRIPGVEPAKEKELKTVDDKLLAETTYAQIKSYLTAVLNRADRFHQALNAPVRGKAPVTTFAYGSECEPTPNAVVLVRETKSREWRTLTQPREFRTSADKEVTKKAMQEAVFAPGDGNVTRRSLLGETVSERGGKTITKIAYPFESSSFFCAQHHKLLNNPEILSDLLVKLGIETLKQPDKSELK